MTQVIPVLLIELCVTVHKCTVLCMCQPRLGQHACACFAFDSQELVYALAILAFVWLKHLLGLLLVLQSVVYSLDGLLIPSISLSFIGSS